MKKQIQKPTEAELEILNILWESGHSTVKFVNDILNKKREVGYTTTLKIMQIMADKKLLARKKEGRSHVYAPLGNENETKIALLDKVLDSVFAGSAAKLVMHALGNNKTTKAEIEEIKNYLNEIEGKIK
ncbi:MAG: BlaI/MecI/CopY family transcriptional regulator [bacterium]